MSIAIIQAHVANVLSTPAKGDAFDARLDEMAAAAGTPLTPKSRKRMRKHTATYVDGSVWLLAQVDLVTTQMGLQAIAAPLIQTAAQYYLAPHDMIPDQAGLYGLMDDAYLTVRFMTRMSEMFQAQAGVALYDTSLDEMSPRIRDLIGEPLASHLDQTVENSLALAVQQANMAAMQPVGFQDKAAWAQHFRTQERIATETEIMAIAGGSF
ncbi:hypothetical protein [Aliiroseovarius sp. YM-037]|uniref:hypothetical protein n=1 Tax=Aliiroseovarius sp. YM-037 TaxID=3341728 RepID=UPI003A803F7B